MRNVQGESTRPPDPHAVGTVRDLMHAVRNSLSLILGYSHILRTRPLAQASPESLQTICRESERIARLLSLIPESLGEVAVQTATLGTPGRSPKRR